MTSKSTAVSRPFASGDFASGLLSAFTGAFTGLFRTVAEWQRRSEERHHIRQLDERLLRDMGLRRIDAMTEADKPFWEA